MYELLTHSTVLQILPYSISNELAAIVISQRDGSGDTMMLPEYAVDQPDDMLFPDMPSQHLAHNATAVHIQHSQ